MSVSNSIKLNQTQYSILFIASLTLLLLGVIFLTACQVSEEALAGQPVSTGRIPTCTDADGNNQFIPSVIEVSRNARLTFTADGRSRTTVKEKVCNDPGSRSQPGRDVNFNCPNGMVMIQQPNPARAGQFLEAYACKCSTNQDCGSGYQCNRPGVCAVCTPSSEICDGQDNDCNGIVDDGFSLGDDPNNCGSCGNVCSQGLVCNGNGQCVVENLPLDAQCNSDVECSSGLCGDYDGEVQGSRYAVCEEPNSDPNGARCRLDRECSSGLCGMRDDVNVPILICEAVRGDNIGDRCVTGEECVTQTCGGYDPVRGSICSAP